MEAAAERACRAVGYVNAGTFEFLLGPDGAFSFIELNARLQVEHPVTELCTGIDLVRAQLEVAAGEPLARDGPRAAPRARDRDPPERRGSDARLHAGAGHGHALPAAARARACASTRSSRTAPTISPYYDSLIAKLVVWDADRPAAIARAERALEETVDRGRADDARARARRSSRSERVPERRLLDLDARRARQAVRGMTPRASTSDARDDHRARRASSSGSPCARPRASTASASAAGGRSTSTQRRRAPRRSRRGAASRSSSWPSARRRRSRRR